MGWGSGGLKADLKMEGSKLYVSCCSWDGVGEWGSKADRNHQINCFGGGGVGLWGPKGRIRVKRRAEIT